MALVGAVAVTVVDSAGAGAGNTMRSHTRVRLGSVGSSRRSALESVSASVARIVASTTVVSSSSGCAPWRGNSAATSVSVVDVGSVLTAVVHTAARRLGMGDSGPSAEAFTDTTGTHCSGIAFVLALELICCASPTRWFGSISSRFQGRQPVQKPGNGITSSAPSTPPPTPSSTPSTPPSTASTPPSSSSSPSPPSRRRVQR